MMGQAHREVFADSPPATTIVEIQRLIAPEMLIEIEVDAVAVRPCGFLIRQGTRTKIDDVNSSNLPNP